MSKETSAGSKKALVLAGVVASLAIIVSLSAGVFMPLIDQSEEPDAVVETAAQPDKQASPTQVASGWADDDGAGDDGGDDWGSPATDSGAAFGSRGGGPSEIAEPEFADFTPESAAAGSTSSRRGAGSGDSSQRVTSGAAPNAPRLGPPPGGGNGGSGSLTVE